MKNFLYFILALVVSGATAGCLADDGGEGRGFEICSGENFVPVDDCAAPICDARRELAELEQQRQAVQGHLACSKDTDPTECAHGSQKGSDADSLQEPDMPSIQDVEAAQRRLSALQDSYSQCCSDNGGDTSFGSTTEPDYISITVWGKGDSLIGYINRHEQELDAQVSILGCEHNQVELLVKNVYVPITGGFNAQITDIHASGSFFAQKNWTDTGSMTVAFDAHVTIKLGDNPDTAIGVASDTITFVVSTDAEGGSKFALDEQGKANGHLVTVDFVQGQPGGALEAHQLELNMALDVKGLQDPFLSPPE